mmetsp:Transcript_8485/g.23605  ORF Transcript_8485/g.23605 Transcript_8485/m.23605 type:complete len:93 (-) Transcript_8485:506-784(-)
MAFVTEALRGVDLGGDIEGMNVDAAAAAPAPKLDPHSKVGPTTVVPEVVGVRVPPGATGVHLDSADFRIAALSRTRGTGGEGMSGADGLLLV